MGLFSRKQKKNNAWDNISDENSSLASAPEEPQECDHKWQDFPWYIEGQYFVDRKYYELDIIEPYVCLRCHKRENKVLAHFARMGSEKDVDAAIEQLKKNYAPKIKRKAEVEDMIQDTIMIDPGFLKYFYMLNGGKNPSVSTHGYRSDTTDDDNDENIELKL